jgi:hypothetical protein
MKKESDEGVGKDCDGRREPSLPALGACHTLARDDR